jgi:hypothetical protein
MLFGLFILNILYILPKIELKNEDYFKSRKINQIIPEGYITNKFIDTTFGERNAN